MQTLNILILGNSGSGKSSLANSIFGKNVFEVSSTEQNSQDSRITSSVSITEDAKRIRIIDTPGINLDQMNMLNARKIGESIFECIDDQDQENKQINAILIVEALCPRALTLKSSIERVGELFGPEALKSCIYVMVDLLGKGISDQMIFNELNGAGMALIGKMIYQGKQTTELSRDYIVVVDNTNPNAEKLQRIVNEAEKTHPYSLWMYKENLEVIDKRLKEAEKKAEEKMKEKYEEEKKRKEEELRKLQLENAKPTHENANPSSASAMQIASNHYQPMVTSTDNSVNTQLEATPSVFNNISNPISKEAHQIKANAMEHSSNYSIPEHSHKLDANLVSAFQVPSASPSLNFQAQSAGFVFNPDNIKLAEELSKLRIELDEANMKVFLLETNLSSKIVVNQLLQAEIQNKNIQLQTLANTVSEYQGYQDAYLKLLAR